MRLGVAIAAGEEAALERFLALHREWPEAAESLRAARRELVRIAFAAAQASATPAGWTRFVERFHGWEEAQRELEIARGSIRR